MEAVEQPQDVEELRLLLDWGTAADQGRTRRAGGLSIAAHVVAILVLVSLPRDAPQPAPRKERVTPLVAPLTEPTQIAPNRGKVSKSFDIESLKPRPRIQVPPSPPRTAKASAPALTMPAPSTSQRETLPEPPKIESAAKDPGPKLPLDTPQAPPPPQIQTEEPPKLAFETPRPASRGTAEGLGKLAPSGTVAEAVRNLAHENASGGRVAVGDTMEMSGIGESINQKPTPAKQGSNLELMSDPLGVDFKPYLLQILAIVRRNWFSVMPESTKQGRQGKVALQFAIAKSGEVTKVVVASDSGTDALDRAAIASISMSNPFPPLPAEFRGSVIRLQFTFAYNLRTH